MMLEHFDSILAFVLIITGVSLIITTLTQMVSALFGLRGTNLRWGIQTLLANVDPDLKEHAEEISGRVLKHSLASDSAFSSFEYSMFNRWRLASAIRKEELVAILRSLANPPAGKAAANSGPGWMVALQESFRDPDPELAAALTQVATQVRQLLPNDPERAQRFLSPLVDSAAGLPGKISQWFDSVMDRASQRFAVHTRIWTVVFAVLLSFALQLDAFRLYTRLSSTADVRAQVLASADALAKRADEHGASPTNGSPAVYVVAMKQMIADHRGELKAVAEPAGFTTLAGGKDWLAGELKRQNISDPENQWARRFEDQLSLAPFRAASDNLNSLLADKLIVEIVPDPYPDPIYRDWLPSHRAFWGMMFSAALLSLGAPFWFNILKTLSNLQPVLANKQQKESAEDQS